MAAEDIFELIIRRRRGFLDGSAGRVHGARNQEAHVPIKKLGPCLLSCTATMTTEWLKPSTRPDIIEDLVSGVGAVV